MRDIWFTSDTHFGHENIIYYAGRPFEDTDDMDEAMIENWNQSVKPQDLVYHLGDFSMTATRGKEVRKLLNGTIRLVVGNHDPIMKFAQAGIFQRMTESVNLERITDRLAGVYATHRPVELGKTVQFNLHGHIHHRDTNGQRLNLSVEKTDYKPVHLETMIDQIAAVRSEEE